MSVEIPTNVIGRVGMVAGLKRVRGSDLGKLVLVREPAGVVTALVGSERPVFAWLADLLGERGEYSGRVARSIYVADPCLVPVSALSEDEMLDLAETLSRKDFEDELAKFNETFGADFAEGDDLDRLLNTGYDDLLLINAKESVATPDALKEIGFRAKGEDGETLVWPVVYNGFELVFVAGSDGLLRWHLLATGTSSRQSVCEELYLPSEDIRGRIVLTVLKMCRTAFGNDFAPDCLRQGLLYEHHLSGAHKRREEYAVGYPTAYCDGVVFRAVMKWLRTRHRDMLLGDGCVSLSFADGMLRIAVDDIAYGVPARGHFRDRCRVRLSEFLNYPTILFQGPEIEVVVYPDHVLVGEQSLRRVENEN